MPTRVTRTGSRRYRLGFAAKSNLFANVVDVTVASPRTLMGQTRPPEKETPAPTAAALFRAEYRTLTSYTAPGTFTNALPLLYATAEPIANESPVTVFLAQNVIGFEFELALTNRT